MNHSLARSRTTADSPSWPKKLILGAAHFAESVAEGVKHALEQAMHSESHEWSTMLEHIRKNIQNPRYLDTNDAIRDFKSLVFVIHRKKFFAGMTEREVYKTERELLKFVLFLRELSNQSGLIEKRQSGYSAFSHWMEAAFIYLENDPHPTLQGLKEVAAHDSLEDPNFNSPKKSTLARWKTSDRVRQQLEKYGGAGISHAVETKLTKPVATGEHLDDHHREIWRDTQGENASEKAHRFFAAHSPDVHAKAKHNRNRTYLAKIQESEDETFRKKLSDTLSNIRNIDAYVLLEPNGSSAQEAGRRKMERKCMEIVEFFLPKAKDTAPSYYVQLVSELESLKRTYGLSISLDGHRSDSPAFQLAMDRSNRNGIEFVETTSRRISDRIISKRSALEARRRKF